MSDLWENIKKNLFETSEAIAEKVDEYSRQGRVRLDIMNEKRKLVRKFAELGTRTYELVDAGEAKEIKDDLEVLSLVQEIHEIREELNLKRKSLKDQSEEA